ncbi:hypothetical protein DUNSADRAFT_13074 [Dunaliella salina]|uniref:Uncharacterized protein n=1 Tax=Dunaliella salina TaxID=3046 RepID=A0ABQ7H3N8_DUNSA|nr:hypothetical protein DUNSADRAFT_13074 [Dunaliella salina]|eukprot:KAF5841411.1 hypothetical protein DUNSADRAFT_13074 [Dunaliella salina]
MIGSGETLYFGNDCCIDACPGNSLGCALSAGGSGTPDPECQATLRSSLAHWLTHSLTLWLVGLLKHLRLVLKTTHWSCWAC